MRIRSSMGSSRWNFLQDSEGNPIRPPDRSLLGYSMRAVHETPTHALSCPSRVEADEKAFGLASAAEKLTGEERRVLDLQGKLFWLPDEKRVLKDDHETLSAVLEEGYEQTGYADEKTLVLERRSWRQPTYAEIAAELGLSVHQVHRRVKTAHEKLRTGR